jgi:hypothetical protein
MTTFSAGQISFIFLVFVLLVLAIALVICTNNGKNKTHHNNRNNNRDNDMYGFYQKKVSFQLDDNLEDNTFDANHLVLESPQVQVQESTPVQPQESPQVQPRREIIDNNITSAFVSI